MKTVVVILAALAVTGILLDAARTEQLRKTHGALAAKERTRLFAGSLFVLCVCGIYWSYADLILGQYVEAIFLFLTTIAVLPMSVRSWKNRNSA